MRVGRRHSIPMTDMNVTRRIGVHRQFIPLLTRIIVVDAMDPLIIPAGLPLLVKRFRFPSYSRQTGLSRFFYLSASQQNLRKPSVEVDRNIQAFSVRFQDRSIILSHSSLHDCTPSKAQCGRPLLNWFQMHHWTLSPTSHILQAGSAGRRVHVLSTSFLE